MKGIFERLFGKPAHEEKMTVGGIFHLTCYKDASMKEILWEENAINKVTNQGLDNLGSTYFYSTAKLSNAWYLALVNTNTTATAAMTYATPVYTESTADGHRQSWGSGASSSQAVTNASPAVFTNGGDSGTPATETIYGVALVGANAACVTAGDKAATGGILHSFGLLSSAQPWVSGNVINVTYTSTQASST